MDTIITCNKCGYYPNGSCIHPDKEWDIKDFKDEETAKVLCPLEFDNLDARRYRVKYRKENLYLTVAFYEGKPWEVFASEKADFKDPNLDYMNSSITAITRLASHVMQHQGVEKVVSQLRKSSIRKTDFPGILSDILEEYIE